MLSGQSGLSGVRFPDLRSCMAAAITLCVLTPDVLLAEMGTVKANALSKSSNIKVETRCTPKIMSSVMYGPMGVNWTVHCAGDE